ncbi:hypothetical protein [Streptococcus pneumoniae]|nr:hypothetical protein [Streptococcus pneumoniae]
MAFKLFIAFEKLVWLNEFILADRNILVDQTMAEDFRPFEKVMTKITPKL